jgi:hypothetical protein
LRSPQGWRVSVARNRFALRQPLRRSHKSSFFMRSARSIRASTAGQPIVDACSSTIPMLRRDAALLAA